MKNKQKPTETVDKTKTPEKNVEEPIEAVEELKTTPLTPEEQAIFLRVSKPGTDWDTVKEEELVDFSLSADKYALPEEAQKLQDERKFAFRFIAMTPTRIDQVTNQPHPAKWDICNRANTPFLVEYCDPVHGAIQVEDQMLMYKPWHIHVIHQAHKNAIASAKDRSGIVDSKNGETEEHEKGYIRTEYVTGQEARIGGGDFEMGSADA